MPPRCSALQSTLTPFLYPFLFSQTAQRASKPFLNSIRKRHESTLTSEPLQEQTHATESHLNPPPTSYSAPIFTDRATLTLTSGPGGHGCISFLREKYIAYGPPNGGDGGSGGNIYIQAVRGETSLHKLARRGNIRAGRGRNGQGKTKGGERGDDVVLQVPVGTIVRETERHDPVAEEEERLKLEAGKEDGVQSQGWKWDREKWLLYPAITKEDIATAEFPRLPKGRKPPLAAAAAKAPISLDLSQPMERPILLAAGAVGGLGNPHFVTKTVPRPKFATKGEQGIKLTLELELKLLADVGLVGLPNAGKSTLLRAMSNSRTRVGDWAFTTLQPNIGTVVLDNHHGRPPTPSVSYETGEPRTNFTIADIPGLVEDAHLDRGLGISFLRHVERARVLAFVIDLSAGDAVEALKGLWKEVALYEALKTKEIKEATEPLVNWSPFLDPHDALNRGSETISYSYGPSFESPLAPSLPSIRGKPWFVVATKADLEGTKERFEELRGYLEGVNEEREEHPAGEQGKEGWQGKAEAIPVSALNGQGVERITELVAGLLDGSG